MVPITGISDVSTICSLVGISDGSKVDSTLGISDGSACCSTVCISVDSTVGTLHFRCLKNGLLPFPMDEQWAPQLAFPIVPQ